ncbi:unnamed protein product [Lactuca saligna]|uniref:Uncharacterized protein n=1 Tax=Lactuca saligna TaxID=75948 RepID=A0AA36EHK9_LACSI|nr:unnamed protein product [Lactuca saligna]
MLVHTCFVRWLHASLASRISISLNPHDVRFISESLIQIYRSSPLVSPPYVYSSFKIAKVSSLSTTLEPVWYNPKCTFWSQKSRRWRSNVRQIGSDLRFWSSQPTGCIIFFIIELQ